MKSPGCVRHGGAGGAGWEKGRINSPRAFNRQRNQQNSHGYLPISQVCKLRLREIRRLVRGHRAGQHHVWASADPSSACTQNPCSPHSAATLSTEGRLPCSRSLGACLPVPPAPLSGGARPHLQGHPDVVGHLADQGLRDRVGGVALLAVHLDHGALGRGSQGSRVRPRGGPALARPAGPWRGNGSTSPCGIRAGGSPHACPCGRQFKGRGWQTGAGPVATHQLSHPWQTSPMGHSAPSHQAGRTSQPCHSVPAASSRRCR